MDRKKYLIGNWKLNQNINQIKEFFNYYLENETNFYPWIAPQFIHIPLCLELCANKIQIGSQTISHFKDGAYTGEVGAQFLKEMNVHFTLIGHSERRQYLYESEKLFAKKIQVALENNIVAVYCVGESLKEREEEKTFEVIKEQLKKALLGLKLESSDQLIIAYEPVWAIGTGKSASPEDANKVHEFISSELKTIFPTYGKNISILYGGSVKPENIDELCACSHIDGALVGGASLNAETFIKLGQSLSKLMT